MKVRLFICNIYGSKRESSDYLCQGAENSFLKDDCKHKHVVGGIFNNIFKHQEQAAKEKKSHDELESYKTRSKWTMRRRGGLRN